MKKLFSAPFIAFIICGTIIPMFVIAYYGLTTRTGTFTISNVASIANPDHLKALGLSLLLSFGATLICLILAFPLGLILKGSKIGGKSFIIFVFILPMWMNFVLRTMAWQVILEIEYDKVDKVRGMDIIFVTTAKTDEEARELLTLFGMPFKK